MLPLRSISLLVLLLCFLLSAQLISCREDSIASSSEGVTASSAQEEVENGVYDPDASRTYVKKFKEYFTYGTKTVEYLGGEAYTGYTCRDMFGFLDYWDMYDMLCVPGDDAEYLPFDGIVGIGPNSTLVNGHIFAIYLGFTAGELQVNGYVPECVYNNEPVKMMPIADGAEYGYKVKVDSLSMSAGALTNTLYTIPITIGDDTIPMTTVVDSGTQRIMLPSNVTSVKNGVATTISLYDDVVNWMQANPAQTFTMTLSIGGDNYSVILDVNSIGQLTQDYSSTMILGQFFFWYNVVVHDLTDPTQPKIGFGQSNLRYVPASVPNQNSSAIRTYPLNYASDDQFRYYTNVDVGSPAVTLSVLVDTGSKDIVVSSTKHFGMPWWVITSGAVIALGVVVIIIRLGFRGNKPWCHTKNYDNIQYGKKGEYHLIQNTEENL